MLNAISWFVCGAALMFLLEEHSFSRKLRSIEDAIDGIRNRKPQTPNIRVIPGRRP